MLLGILVMGICIRQLQLPGSESHSTRAQCVLGLHFICTWISSSLSLGLLHGSVLSLHGFICNFYLRVWGKPSTRTEIQCCSGALGSYRDFFTVFPGLPVEREWDSQTASLASQVASRSGFWWQCYVPRQESWYWPVPNRSCHPAILLAPAENHAPKQLLSFSTFHLWLSWDGAPGS